MRALVLVDVDNLTARRWAHGVVTRPLLDGTLPALVQRPPTPDEAVIVLAMNTETMKTCQVRGVGAGTLARLVTSHLWVGWRGVQGVEVALGLTSPQTSDHSLIRLAATTATTGHAGSFRTVLLLSADRGLREALSLRGMPSSLVRRAPRNVWLWTFPRDAPHGRASEACAERTTLAAVSPPLYFSTPVQSAWPGPDEPLQYLRYEAAAGSEWPLADWVEGAPSLLTQCGPTRGDARDGQSPGSLRGTERLRAKAFGEPGENEGVEMLGRIPSPETREVVEVRAGAIGGAVTLRVSSQAEPEQRVTVWSRLPLAAVQAALPKGSRAPLHFVAPNSGQPARVSLDHATLLKRLAPLAAIGERLCVVFSSRDDELRAAVRSAPSELPTQFWYALPGLQGSCKSDFRFALPPWMGLQLLDPEVCADATMCRIDATLGFRAPGPCAPRVLTLSTHAPRYSLVRGIANLQDGAGTRDLTHAVLNLGPRQPANATVSAVPIQVLDAGQSYEVKGYFEADAYELMRRLPLMVIFEPATNS